MNKTYNSILESVIYTIHRSDLNSETGKRYIKLVTNYLSKRLIVKYSPYMYELEQIKKYYPNEYKDYIRPFEEFLARNHEK